MLIFLQTIVVQLIHSLSLNKYIFQAMFTIPEGQSFWQSFTDQVDHFKELTKDMSEEKMLSLIADPTSVEKITGKVHSTFKNNDFNFIN